MIGCYLDLTEALYDLGGEDDEFKKLLDDRVGQRTTVYQLR